MKWPTQSFLAIITLAGFTIPLAQVQAAAKSQLTASGMTITDQKTGTGASAINGHEVVVNYTGWLYDPTQPQGHGKKFDSSYDHHQTFSFTLGSGQVIQGWDQGVVGMKVGGDRTLLIPPDLGYGQQGAPGIIPPNSTLIFDVELVDVH